MQITEWKVCRICGGRDLSPVLSLGNLCLSSFLKPGDPLPPKVPLDLLICETCDLVQLRHSVTRDDLFRRYWYKSGVNEAMQAELADLVTQARVRVGGFTSGDSVIDIGANDGTLLSYLPKDVLTIAFEPARNLYDDLRSHANVLISDYFPSKQLQQVQAKAIFAVAMFYDLDDPHSFLENVREMLHPDGIFIVQFQDLAQMIDQTAYDNLVHEHVTCLTLKDLIGLCADHGLVVAEVERRAINGGSLRLYVRHQHYMVQDSVPALLLHERDLYDRLQHFAYRIGERRQQLQDLLGKIGQQDLPIDLYGASTKFGTLAQYCGLDHTVIRQAAERSPEKFGLTTVTGIPIIPEAEWREDPAPYTLVGIWQWRDLVLLREARYLLNGGSFILPLPVAEVVCASITDGFPTAA